MFVRLSIATALLITLAANATRAEDWGRFRGPNGSGVASDTGLPVEFDAERGVVWAAEVPFGRSSPAFTEDRIFLTAVEGDELVTMALDRASGEMLWRRVIEKRLAADLHLATDSASASPVTDGENVYSFFHEAGLVSYDSRGQERWRMELGPFRNFYSIAASPVVHDGRLFMVVDQVQGSFMLAVDTATGREAWRQPRLARLESYATPLLYPEGKKPTEIVVVGSSWIDAYDLKTGEVNWTLSGVGVSPVASPTLDGDLLFVSAPDHAAEPLPPFEGITKERDTNGDGELSREEVDGYWMDAHFGFVDVDGNGSISAADYAYLQKEMVSDSWGVFGIRLGRGEDREILWNVRQSVPYIPSPLAYDGVLYIAKDTILTSLDPETGEVLKRGRLGQGKSGLNASPVAGDGKIYLARTDGTIAVLSAGAEWEILALNEMGSEIHATPVIADGGLYVRTSEHLVRLSGADAEAGSSGN